MSFGLNFVMFCIDEPGFAAALEARPRVLAFNWSQPDQDLRSWFQRAHDAGILVMHVAGEVPEAVRAAEAGADLIVSQGTEGGGHVGWMGSMVLTPMIVSAVAPRPVLAAGGIADGRGLAAALALGADGVVVGTRFLATTEAPLHPRFKECILQSDGHDTVLTEIPDLAAGRLWPGAMARVLRNRFIERWAGREWLLRRRQQEVQRKLIQARQAGDADEASLLVGQDAGLIDSVVPASEAIRKMVNQAEEIVTRRLSALAGRPGASASPPRSGGELSW